MSQIAVRVNTLVGDQYQPFCCMSLHSNYDNVVDVVKRLFNQPDEIHPKPVVKITANQPAEYSITPPGGYPLDALPYVGSFHDNDPDFDYGGSHEEAWVDLDEGSLSYMSSQSTYRMLQWICEIVDNKVLKDNYGVRIADQVMVLTQNRLGMWKLMKAKVVSIPKDNYSLTVSFPQYVSLKNKRSTVPVWCCKVLN